jgi:hypothetical protein
MSKGHATGLGEPAVVGKKTLFLPPEEPPAVTKKPVQKIHLKPKKSAEPILLKRVHVTFDLTLKALEILEKIQRNHRLRTGKVLPIWKAASQAIEHYGRSKEGDLT